MTMPRIHDHLDLRPLGSLVPYARNARTHSPVQIDQIAASIREFGFTNPVLVDADGGIIAGHGRVLAAAQVGLDRVPCLRLDGLSEAQRRAYVLADNRLALNAGWDEALLAAELADLAALDFDLGLTGFDPGEIAALVADIGDRSSGESTPEPGGASRLSDRFLAPPFSVLNARDRWWQERKRAWISIGIQSELGRGEQLIPNGGGLHKPDPLRKGGQRNPGGIADARL